MGIDQKKTRIGEPGAQWKVPLRDRLCPRLARLLEALRGVADHDPNPGAKMAEPKKSWPSRAQARARQRPAPDGIVGADGPPVQEVFRLKEILRAFPCPDGTARPSMFAAFCVVPAQPPPIRSQAGWNE